MAGRDPKSIKPFPTGLKVVTDRNAGVVGWACIGGGRDTPDQAGTPEQETPPDCQEPMHLVQRIHFPDCWDGHNLDSADHRSHMAYASTTPADSGRCPPRVPGHPPGAPCPTCGSASTTPTGWAVPT